MQHQRCCPKISIHALREEGDSTPRSGGGGKQNFYPRPPRGGRLLAFTLDSLDFLHFYPRPPRGGRPVCGACAGQSDTISIHALREEGDRPCLIKVEVADISIHALREEGDGSAAGAPPFAE